MHVAHLQNRYLVRNNSTAAVAKKATRSTRSTLRTLGLIAFPLLLIAGVAPPAPEPLLPPSCCSVPAPSECTPRSFGLHAPTAAMPYVLYAASSCFILRDVILFWKRCVCRKSCFRHENKKYSLVTWHRPSMAHRKTKSELAVSRNQ